MKAFLPALALALFNVLSAPFLGQVRNALLARFPATFLKVLAVSLVVALAVVLALAVARIREHRGWRYGGLLLVVALVALQTFVLGRDIADPTVALQVNLVEKLHFVQYGLLAFLLYRALRPAADISVPVRTLLGVAAAGTCEEWVQWFVPLRVGEVTDVGLNLYAGLCGLIFAWALQPPSSWSWQWGGRWPATARLAALVVVLFGAFFHCAHLGYLVDDPEIGRFRSWFDRDTLLQVEAQRAQRWAQAPPRLRALGREDHYLSAAAWHVSHRNHSYQIGDFFSAWKESQILGRYFSPVLDLPPLRTGSPGFRLPPEQLQEIEQRHPRPDPYPYLSPVLAERVFLRPTAGELWLGVMVLAGLLLAFSRRR